METLEFAGRDAWRSWLASNHGSTDGIWMVFNRVSTGISAIPYEDAVEEALCFGWIDSIVRRLDERRYCRKFTPRRPGSVWSALNRARVAKLMAEGRMTPAGMAMVEEAKSSGEWLRVEVRPTFPLEAVPAELSEALEGDDAATAFFESLPASCRKRYILWIVSAKKPETRSRRAAEAAAMLARGERPGLK